MEVAAVCSEEPAGSGEKVDFYGLSRERLAALLQERFDLTAYRSVQLFEWVYKKKITDISLMTNIAKDLREKLQDFFHFSAARILDRQVSVDGSIKFLVEVRQGIVVETVLINQPTRKTLCVSSQYGCGMGCKFCRTATMGFQGNLQSGDIIRQVMAAKEDFSSEGECFNNIVFMGMGEPLHNFRAVADAIHILRDDLAFGIGARKITVSTVGLVPGIKKFAAEGLDVNLAVSLNATTDKVRNEIMPVNQRFPIAELISCIKDFPFAKRRKATIEYVMLAGVNDSDADLVRLVELIRGLRVKVNLIPYNPGAGCGYESPTRSQIVKWQDGLNQQGIDATIRWSKGLDINGACGQLAHNRQPEPGE